MKTKAKDARKDARDSIAAINAEAHDYIRPRLTVNAVTAAWPQANPY